MVRLQFLVTGYSLYAGHWSSEFGNTISNLTKGSDPWRMQGAPMWPAPLTTSFLRLRFSRPIMRKYCTGSSDAPKFLINFHFQQRPYADILSCFDDSVTIFDFNLQGCSEIICRLPPLLSFKTDQLRGISIRHKKGCKTLPC